MQLATLIYVQCQTYIQCTSEPKHKRHNINRCDVWSLIDKTKRSNGTMRLLFGNITRRKIRIEKYKKKYKQEGQRAEIMIETERDRKRRKSLE